MRLTEEEYYQYLRIHPALLYFVGLEEKLIDKNSSLESFMNFPMEDKIPVREKLYEKIGYVEKFVQKNPANLSDEDLEIAKEFKHFRKGKFWVIKYLKNYTIFLDDNYAYGVLALSDPFEWFWGDSIPLMVQAVLLPFKDKIIYDGIMQTYNVFFGRGISTSVKNDYNQAKAKYGIITSLPIDEKTKKTKFTEKDQLELYMKNASSREQHWYEIEEMIENNPSLKSFYDFLWGKINARGKKKILKELGLENFYFAIYNDVIIASGKTKPEIEGQLKGMLKKEDRNAIYLFKT